MGAVARREARRRSAVRVGLVGAAAASVLIAFAVTAKNGLPDYLPGVERTTIRVAFDDVGALREGDDVRIADVRSGFVQKIALQDGRPVVTMQLNGGRPVYRGATASIAARSGLGQKYVALSPGRKDTGRLLATETLASTRTSTPTELDDVLDSLDKKTRESLASTLRETGRGAAGRGRDLNDGLSAANDLLTDLGAVSKALSADDGADLSQMLTSAKVLSEGLDGQEKQIAATTRQLSKTLNAFTVDDGQPLTATVTKVDETLKALKPTLDELNGPLADTESAVRRLQPGAVALGSSMPDLRAFLRESPTTLEKVPDLADDAKPAVESLTGAVDDATPLVTQLGTTLGRAELPLRTIAPYASEVLLFFQNTSSALSQGDSAGRWLRYYPILLPESILGTVPLRDPTTSREAYPAPNKARTHREGSIFGEGFQ